MNDRLVEHRRDTLLLSTDRRRVDVDAVLAMLHASHWGGSMTRELLVRAMENSVCVSVYDERRDPQTGGAARQLSFARVVTDLATYAYLTDVIVAEHARGHGIGRWMIESILSHPDMQGLRRFALWTRDAPGLYARYGFTTSLPGSNYMELRSPR